MTLKAAVLYATYGHWTQALKNAGIDVTYHFSPALKFDPEKNTGMIRDGLATQILRLNFPEIEVRPPSVNDEAYDLIVGSPPCVGMSRANPKACFDHPFNKHTLNFFKWVGLNGPRYFIMEMVPGLLENKDLFHSCLNVICDSYTYDYAIMDAKDFGAAQTRKRLIFFGSSRDGGEDTQLLSRLPVKPFTPIKEALDQGLVFQLDSTKPDGRILMNHLKPDGSMIAGAWGSLTPEKRKNRTLKPDGVMFTITGTSVRDCFHYSKQRLLAVPELKLLMGFPYSYKLPFNINAGLASKIIASGIDIRFATHLLDTFRMMVED